MKIGVCGTGRMGSSIAQRLMSLGHQIGVWNRDAAKTKPLTEAGATRYESPADLVAGSDVVIVMLLNDAACDAIYRDPQGILNTRLAGKLVIDMSTVRPDTMQTLGGLVISRGAAFVESPVGGSTAPAREGKLFALVGGEKADVQLAMPILEQLCRRIEHIGQSAVHSRVLRQTGVVCAQPLRPLVMTCQVEQLPAHGLDDHVYAFDVVPSL